MEGNELMGKKIFIRTKHNKFYNGSVLDIQQIKDNTYIKLRDKFGEILYILYDEVVELKIEGVANGIAKSSS